EINHIGDDNMNRYLFWIIMITIVVPNFVIASTTVFPTEIADIPVGKWPNSVCVNPQTDMIYVSDWGSNTVSVINGKNNSILKTLYVGRGPWGM
ncbi:MAG: YncE family protein, partial [Athalassotoga sp.]